jgi:hypothetical protein
VRFGGPGPLAPPDPDDNGILSIGIKVMGVPGPKLLEDERETQDFSGISAPTFTTPNVVENLKLQRQHAAALFHQSIRFAPGRHDHAGPLRQAELIPAGGSLFQLRAVSLL